METEKKAYRTPEIEEWTVAELTQLGTIETGPDVFPGNAQREGGSVCPPSGTGQC
jgi:hypothetical protein